MTDSFKIKGTAFGNPIDVVISECTDEDTVTPESPEVQDIPPETVPDSAEVEDAPTPADPAPPVNVVDDEPKNPAGNAEQV